MFPGMGFVGNAEALEMCLWWRDIIQHFASGYRTVHSSFLPFAISWRALCSSHQRSGSVRCRMGHCRSSNCYLYLQPHPRILEPTIPSKYIDSRIFFISNFVPNILADVIILCLPIQKIRELNLPRKRKIAVSGIFLLGGL